MVLGRDANFLKSRRFWTILGGSLATLLLGMGIAAWWADSRLHAPFPEHRDTPEFFVVAEGESGSTIARNLEEQGLIESAVWFRLLLRLRGDDYQLQAGEYRFDRPRSMAEVADKLNRGAIFYHKVTVPEGLDRRDIAGVWWKAGFGERDEFLAQFTSPQLIQDLDAKATNLEGYLLPETYLVPRQESPLEITRQMVETFRNQWNEKRRQQARDLGLTLRQVVTLASLVEKETSLDSERRLVSAVFHNRLRLNMKLECDPTVIYAVKEVKPFDGIIHRSDLKMDSPYNTYLYPGLPPGPICNPGMASIDAALDPAPVQYLFFVARNDGSHVFSENYREHQRAVLKYQR